MVVRRSQEASKLEQSSQRHPLPKGIVTWIALLLLLLVSSYLLPVILGNDPSSVCYIIHAPRKDRFSRRNQYNYYFNIQKTNRNSIWPTYHDSGEHGLQYHLAASIPRTNKPSNGCRQIMPPRWVKKNRGEFWVHQWRDKEGNKATDPSGYSRGKLVQKQRVGD